MNYEGSTSLEARFCCDVSSHVVLPGKSELCIKNDLPAPQFTSLVEKKPLPVLLLESSEDDEAQKETRSPRRKKARRPRAFKFRGNHFFQVPLDRAILSDRHLVWVEPLFVAAAAPAEESLQQDFIADGPTPKKVKQFKDPFVVEKIVAMTVDSKGADLYFIKWSGHDDMTWEPLSNLDNCPSKLTQFRKDLKRLPRFQHEKKRFEKELQKFVDKISEPWPNRDPNIEVVNEVDLTTPMMTFNYINELAMPKGRELDAFRIGCECEGGICGSKCECATRDRLRAPYDEDGLVKRPQNLPIYECNASCSCDPAVCPYRVVQKGRKVRLQIFKTDNGRGWGVKALEDIKKNQFVVEYQGEVITNEEANRRGDLYDVRGRTYLFDMDLFWDDSTEEKFTIDAKPYGNEARFINHACQPNLFSRCVWWESSDPLIHHLAFFAKKDIKKGEELSFNYHNAALLKSAEEYKANKNDNQLNCKCKKNCSNKLFK